jgi:hypothetical protein
MEFGKARWHANRVMAMHLRTEHGWGIRRIGQRLEMTDDEVRRAVGEAVS